jgi:hypothetical protein
VRESLIDQFIQLRVDSIEGGAQGKWEHSIVAGEHGDSGTKDASFEPGEQAGDLPSVRR